MRVASSYPIVDQIFPFLMSRVPSMAAKHKAHYDYSKEKAESRLGRDTDRKDFISYVSSRNFLSLVLLKINYLQIQRHNNKEGMSRDEIIGTLGVIMLAGSETTATQLSGATYYLLKNPPILRKMQKEIRDAFHAEDEVTLASVSRIDKLPYTDAVLTETLRMYPPVPSSLARVVGSQGDVIDGYFTPPKVS